MQYAGPTNRCLCERNEKEIVLIKTISTYKNYAVFLVIVVYLCVINGLSYMLWHCLFPPIQNSLLVSAELSGKPDSKCEDFEAYHLSFHSASQEQSVCCLKLHGQQERACQVRTEASSKPLLLVVHLHSGEPAVMGLLIARLKTIPGTRNISVPNTQLILKHVGVLRTCQGQ